MINKLEINGVHFKVDTKLKTYVTKKLGKLDKYIPKHARQSAHLEVFLKETKIKAKVEHQCEVVLHLPHDKLTTKESTVNMYAAVDIVEAKLKNQIKKYKTKHGSPQLHHRLIGKLRRTKHEA
jgi:putative sigma-54 modulation protein